MYTSDMANIAYNFSNLTEFHQRTDPVDLTIFLRPFLQRIDLKSCTIALSTNSSMYHSYFAVQIWTVKKNVNYQVFVDIHLQDF